MQASTTVQQQPQHRDDDALRERLTRETIDGVPFYYRGYKRVLAGEAQAEDIMGSSSLQSTILSVILEYLNHIFYAEKRYICQTGKVGLHLGPKDNLACDLAIFEREAIKGRIDERYFEQAPKVVVEIDLKVESESLQGLGYYFEKTQKLLDFGVERVVWIGTKEHEVMVRDSEREVRILKWAEELELLPGVSLKLADLLAERGFNV